MKTRNTLLALVLALGVNARGQAQTNDAQQRALDVLRKTIDSLETSPSGKALPPPRHEPTFSEIERLYLQDKITARELQKYLEEHKVDASRLMDPDTQTKASATESAGPKADGRPVEAGGVRPFSGAGTEPAPDQSNLSDLERKMDELLRLKAARENAAGTNASSNTATNAAAAAPKSKRDRLNELLRQVVEGKITDAQYKELRAKLINEPEW